MRSPLIATLGICLGLLAGCKKDIQNTDAVRQGVMTYLSKRSDLLSMDVSVTSVAFRQNEATASVHFQAKGNNSPGSGMSMEYILERQGSQWVVKGRGGAANAHGAQGIAGAPPSSSGSMDAMPQSLPPGHPSVGGGSASPQLPAGHPAIQPGQRPPGQDR